MSNKHTGSTFDCFLEEEGILEEVSTRAHKRLLALQLDDILKGSELSKEGLAEKRLPPAPFPPGEGAPPPSPGATGSWMAIWSLWVGGGAPLPVGWERVGEGTGVRGRRRGQAILTHLPRNRTLKLSSSLG